MAGSRIERGIVGVLLILAGAAPALRPECFPFSSAPMFAAPITEFWTYRLTDADGTTLNDDLYGLRNNPNWYLESYYAVKYPPNVIAPPTRKPDMEAVISHVREVARKQGAHFPLTLSAVSAGDNEGRSVHVLSREQWTIGDDS